MFGGIGACGSVECSCVGECGRDVCVDYLSSLWRSIMLYAVVSSLQWYKSNHATSSGSVFVFIHDRIRRR